jgi:hypothetical protein
MESLIARGAQVHKDGWAPIHYAATGEEPKASHCFWTRARRSMRAGPTA